MKRLILWFTITFMLISGTGVNAQHPFSSKNTPAQSTAGAWLTLDDVYNAELSPDGNYFAVRTSTHFLLYDISSNQTTPTVVIEDEGASVFFENAALAFSPDGRWVVASIPEDTVTQTVRVWDIASQTVVAEVTRDFYTIDQFEFSPVAPMLVIAHRNGEEYWRGEISLWDIEQNTLRQPIPPNGGIELYPFSPDGQLVLINVGNGSSSLAMILNVETATIQRLGYQGCPCRVNPTWEYVAWYTPANEASGIFALPSGASTAKTDELEAFGGFAWNFDGTLVATIDGQGRARIWDVQNDTQSTVGIGLDSAAGTHLMFHPHQNLIALTRPEHTIEVWSVDSLTLSSEFVAELSGYTDTIARWAFSPDGRWFAVFTNDNMVYVWDIRTESIILATSIQFDSIPSLRQFEFSENGTVLVARKPHFEFDVYVWRLPQE